MDTSKLYMDCTGPASTLQREYLEKLYIYKTHKRWVPALEMRATVWL